MTIIDLLRHGEVSAAHVCLGRHYETPLSAHGWRQMSDLLPEDRNVPWHAIVSSPRRRCADFAEEAATRFHLPLHFDEGFCELGFGTWEGRPWTDLYEQAGESLLAFQRDPLHAPSPAPGGESFQDFELRVGQTWEAWLSTLDGCHWLLIAHAGSLRAILRRILGFPPQKLFNIQLPHATLTRIVYREDFPQLIFHGKAL